MNDFQARKKIQSLIKGWLTEIEEVPGWKTLPPNFTVQIRRSIIRVAWTAYKIGLFTPFNSQMTSVMYKTPAIYVCLPNDLTRNNLWPPS
jgi:hypothetical protein